MSKAPSGMKLTIEQRQESICKMLESKGRISVSELAKSFDVTMQTIRRDLKELNIQNKLGKAHGKAIKYESLYEPMFHSRLGKNIHQKQAIGAFAATLIKSNDAIVCDSTTTVYSFLKALNNVKNITFFINSFMSAQNLQEKFLAGSLTGRIFFFGGEIDFNDNMTHGPILDQEVEKLYFDKAIIGAGGVHFSKGLTAYSDKVGHIANQIINHANEVILLVDSSKIGKRTLYSFSQLEKVTTIVTTIDPPSEKWETLIEQHNIHWINVEKE